MASPVMWPTLVLMWIVFGAMGSVFFHVGIKSVIVGGFLLALGHVAAEVFHQMGHARAARSVGHPMTGVRLHGIVGISSYPANEGELTPEQHLRRALGGAPFSLVATIVAGLLALLVWQVAPHLAWAPFVFFLDNLFFFFLGAFLPLGFNDGSSIIHWSRQRT